MVQVLRLDNGVGGSGESIVVDAWTGTSFLEITDDEVSKRESLTGSQPALAELVARSPVRETEAVLRS